MLLDAVNRLPLRVLPSAGPCIAVIALASCLCPPALLLHASAEGADGTFASPTHRLDHSLLLVESQVWQPDKLLCKALCKAPFRYQQPLR